MSIGDINSKELGSGARFNDGKVMLEYIPTSVFMLQFENLELSREIRESLESFSHYESEGFLNSLHDSLHYLIDIDGWKPCCDVFHYGAQKYAAWNWTKGMSWSVVKACYLRHMYAIINGEEIDEESGLPHIGHAMCNLVMLCYFVDNYPQGDDLMRSIGTEA